MSVAASASRFGMHTENVNPRKKVRLAVALMSRAAPSLQPKALVVWQKGAAGRCPALLPACNRMALVVWQKGDQHGQIELVITKRHQFKLRS